MRLATPKPGQSFAPQKNISLILNEIFGGKSDFKRVELITLPNI